MTVLSRTRTMDLRELAELRLNKRPVVANGPVERELELHKLELQMQNDELRRLHDELARARDHFRMLFDAAPVAYVTLDRFGRITTANRAACQLVGLAPDELVGSCLAALMRTEDADQLHRSTSISTSEAQRIEVELLVPRGACSAILDITSEADTFMVVITTPCRDCASATGHHSRQLAALGASTTTIAHEVNNLLQVAGASLDSVATSLGEVPGADEVRMGQRTLRHCKDLVSRLLVFGLPQAARPPELAIDEFVERTVDMLRPLLGRDIRVVADLGAPAISVTCDPIELELVLINLASNAHDAMPNGGTLTIGTRVVTRTRGTQSAVIVVEDTGTGMSEETQRRIFEPFFTTKPVGVGTGLGLATSLGIVQRARGTLSVWSQEDVGTRFEIALPVATPCNVPFALGTEVQPKIDLVRSDRKTILLVEDNRATRVAMHEHLESIGYRVVTAETAEAALALAEVELLDLALLDYRLRAMSGELLGRHLRQVHPDLRIILTSGYPRDYVPAGEHLFLQKPFSLDELTCVVASALELS